MGQEIEAKMKVADLEAIAKRLEAGGAVGDGEHLETNTFFDTPDNALRGADKGLRLRANLDVHTGKTNYVVTFKGPRQAGMLKTREEIEFSVDDPISTAAAFGALGFATTISFQKRRRSWKLMECKVELDELPYLGNFVEVEGPTADKVMAARQAIGLGNQPIVTDSYAAMLGRYLAENKIAGGLIKLPG